MTREAHPATTGPVDLDEAQQIADQIDHLQLIDHYGNEVIAYGAKTAYRAMNLLPRLVAELRAAREARDENLANVRRIDDLRIAESVHLTRELDDAHAEINQLDEELRIAREAIEELRSWRPTSPSQQALLARYDQAIAKARGGF